MNLGSSLARSWANGALTALVLLAGGLILLAQALLERTQRTSGSLIGWAVVVLGSLVLEDQLVSRVWPALTLGFRP